MEGTVSDLVRKYKKRPTVVEAVQLTQEHLGPIREWLDTSNEPCADGLMIQTLEGRMLASWGDWIVKGVKGEFYPVRRDIFEITYDTHMEWSEE